MYTFRPGQVQHGGSDSSTTQASIRPNHCIRVPQSNGDYYVVFENEQLRPEFVIEFGADGGGGAPALTAQQLATIKAWSVYDAKMLSHLPAVGAAKLAARAAEMFLEVIRIAQRDVSAAEELGHVEELWAIYVRDRKQYDTKLPVYNRKLALRTAPVTRREAESAPIVDSLRQHGTLIVTAETGAGKSTLIPLFVEELVSRERMHALYDADAAAASANPAGMPGFPRMVVVLVPRRAIASGLAKYVGPQLWAASAMERAREPGHDVGYAVRGDVRHWNQREARVVFMTYGTFKMVVKGSPDLAEFAAVVLDEVRDRSSHLPCPTLRVARLTSTYCIPYVSPQVHERGIEVDELLPLVRQAQRRRFASTDASPLRVVIMSATLDPKPFQRYFHKAPHVHVGGRAFPVSDVWFPDSPAHKNYGTFWQWDCLLCAV